MLAYCGRPSSAAFHDRLWGSWQAGRRGKLPSMQVDDYPLGNRIELLEPIPP
jgi:hypothetical protein